MVQETRRLHGKDLTVSKEPVKDENAFCSCFLGVNLQAVPEESTVKHSVYVANTKKGKYMGAAKIYFSSI